MRSDDDVQKDGWVPPDEKCDAEMEESLEDSPWAKQPDAREAEVAVVLIDSSLMSDCPCYR